MSAAYPPLYKYDENDKGGLVVVITYVFLSISASVVAAQLWVNFYYRKRSFTASDALLIAANCLLIPQAILVQYSVNNGLGRHIDTLGENSLLYYYKCTFSQELLLLITMALAKAAVMILTGRIDNVSTQIRIWIVVLAALITIWALFSIFSLAFMCDTPETYIFTNERCGSRRFLWYPILILNVITDFLLATVILPVIMKLQMQLVLRLSISFLFVSRLTVCFVSIGSLAIVGKYITRTDKTWENNTVVALNQIVLHLSCITASLPSLHKFLTEIQTGQMGAHLPENIELGEGSGGRYARARSKQTAGSSGRAGSGLGSGSRSRNRASRRPQSPSESNQELVEIEESSVRGRSIS